MLRVYRSGAHVLKRYDCRAPRTLLPRYNLHMALPLRASPCVRNDPGTGVILAIDYGQKRLGLALSDEHGLTSRPFAIWTRINRRRDLARLRELVRHNEGRRIVIGLPLHLDRTPIDSSAESTGCARRVQNA